MKSEIKVRGVETGWEVIQTFPFKILGGFNNHEDALNYKVLMEKCLLKK